MAAGVATDRRDRAIVLIGRKLVGQVGLVVLALRRFSKCSKSFWAWIVLAYCGRATW